MHKYVQSGPGPYVTPGLTSAVCPEKHVPYRPGISCNADVTCYISSVIKCDYITPPVRMYRGEREERKNKREREMEKQNERMGRRERKREKGRGWKCTSARGNKRKRFSWHAGRGGREREREREEGREAAFTSIRNLLPYPILKYRG